MTQPACILALETSCDDTSAAVVYQGRTVRSLCTQTQTFQQAAYGGVVPEVASRTHLQVVQPVVWQALSDAGIGVEAVDAFAATLGPGLVGSLLVGAQTAKTFAWFYQKPFIGVHHLQAHVASVYLEQPACEPPFLCLLVSGGHTQLRHVQSYETSTLLGDTLDDAAGEAFDKAARLLDLSGGAELANIADQGNPAAYRLPLAQTHRPYDFSFSGLKTFMSRLVAAERQQKPLAAVQADLAASFQQAVVAALVRKTLACARQYNASRLALVGGVSANRCLRDTLTQQATAHLPDSRVWLPAFRFCTDNAAMVGAAAYYQPYTRDLSADVFSRD